MAGVEVESSAQVEAQRCTYDECCPFLWHYLCAQEPCHHKDVEGGCERCGWADCEGDCEDDDLMETYPGSGIFE